MQKKEMPNWEKAPKWATYWAVDPDGRAFWYNSEPFLSNHPTRDELSILGWDFIETDSLRVKFDICVQNVEDWKKTKEPRQKDKCLTMQPEYFKVGKGRNMHTGWPDSGF